MRLYLFTLVLVVLTIHVQKLALKCMHFADDIVLLGESREKLNGKLETWKRALEAYGFRLSKKVYMECNFSKRRSMSSLEMKVGDHIISQVTHLKILGLEYKMKEVL